MRYSGKRYLINELTRRFPNRSKQELYAHVLHGDVLINSHRECNPRAPISPAALIDIPAIDIKEIDATDSDIDDTGIGEMNRVAMAHSPYVSRGGRKLESVLPKALKVGFCFTACVVLDVGAATGGFGDCLLRHGAAIIHAVDLAYGLIDYRLRRDSRVYVHERCNIMSLVPGDLQPEPSLAVADLSFRSITKAASHILALLQGSEPLLLALIKPQFELKYTNLKVPNFSGVLSDQSLVADIVQDTCERLRKEGLSVHETWPAGIRGSKGNQEFFGLIGRT